jgi:hypothetical protein
MKKTLYSDDKHHQLLSRRLDALEQNKNQHQDGWVVLSEADRLHLPSKRSLEKFILRHEVPPFVIQPNSLFYYVVIPRPLSSLPLPPTSYPHTRRAAFDVWPVYTLAHQKRLSIKDQKRYVDLFNRRTSTPEGCALCQLNHVYGLHRSRTFHRLHQCRQMVRRELIEYRRSQLARNTVTPEEVSWYSKIGETSGDNKMIVCAQDARLRHVTANVTTIQSAIFDYPVWIHAPKPSCLDGAIKISAEAQTDAVRWKSLRELAQTSPLVNNRRPIEPPSSILIF